MMDNILKPMGSSLLKDPEVVDLIKQQMAGSGDSPVLARAPLLLSEIAHVPLPRRPQLRAGFVDGSGPGCGLHRSTRSPAHVHMGDHQPPGVRKEVTYLPYPSCPTFIPSLTSFTAPMTSARSASSMCTSSAGSLVATRLRATSLPPGMAASTGPANCAAPPLPPSRPTPLRSRFFYLSAWRNARLCAGLRPRLCR